MTLIKAIECIEFGSIVTVRKRSPMNSAGYILVGVVYDFKDGRVCYKNKLHRCDDVPLKDVLKVHRTMSVDELFTSNDSTLRALGRRLFEGINPVWKDCRSYDASS